jgi:hypothetical protein
MGFGANRITHIREGSRFPGNSSPVLIDQVGEVYAPGDSVPRFPDWSHLIVLCREAKRCDKSCSETCMGTVFLRFTKVFKSPALALSYVGSEARHARQCI